jgi:RNA polymerase sigma factor (sigma-70 family)
MSNHPNNWYIEGLRDGSPEVLRSIFSEFLPQVSSLVRDKYGTNEDAKDVFMDAIEVLYRKIISDDLILTVGFSTFLIQISLYKWYNILRKRKGKDLDLDDIMFSSKIIADNEISFETTDCYKMIRTHFAKLQKDCQLLLSLCWNTDFDMKVIAEQMGWTYGYARTRKYECNQFLIKSIKGDPAFEDCKN